MATIKKAVRYWLRQKPQDHPYLYLPLLPDGHRFPFEKVKHETKLFFAIWENTDQIVLLRHIRNSSHYICPRLLMIVILVQRDFSNIFEVDFVM